MSTFVEEEVTTYRTEACNSCGVQFAMTEEFYKERRRRQDTFYCPAGHGQHYVGKTNEQRLRERLDASEENARRLKWERDHAKRSQAALKGQVTRIKRRVGKGVCPCCNRTFQDLKRHMDGQHPDWSEGD